MRAYAVAVPTAPGLINVGRHTANVNRRGLRTLKKKVVVNPRCCTNLVKTRLFIFFKSLRIPSGDLEDSLLYQLALENDLDYFITSNKSDLKKIVTKKLPVITVKEFLAQLPEQL